MPCDGAVRGDESARRGDFVGLPGLPGARPIAKPICTAIPSTLPTTKPFPTKSFARGFESATRADRSLAVAGFDAGAAKAIGPLNNTNSNAAERLTRRDRDRRKRFASGRLEYDATSAGRGQPKLDIAIDFSMRLRSGCRWHPSHVPASFP